jgi:hypothetical protein
MPPASDFPRAKAVLAVERLYLRASTADNKRQGYDVNKKNSFSNNGLDSCLPVNKQGEKGKFELTLIVLLQVSRFTRAKGLSEAG